MSSTLRLRAPSTTEERTRIASGAPSPGVSESIWYAIEEVWSHTRGDPTVCIALLDGPVDLTHPCFAGARIEQIDLLGAEPPTRGMAALHGTHIASLLFGRHDGPVKGIAPACRGISIPIYTNDARGTVVPCSQTDLARAIVQAVKSGAHVINISGGEFAVSDEPHPLLASALKQCAEHDILVVAAAGNDGCQCLHIPAAVPTVLTVGAMDKLGRPMALSNWGTAYQSKGILAPGEDIVGAVPRGGVAAHTGTSFATPVVAGVAALLASVQVEQQGAPRLGAVRDAILRTAHPCDPSRTESCQRFLVGSLNVAGAYAAIAQKPVTAQSSHCRCEEQATTAAVARRGNGAGFAARAEPAAAGRGAAVRVLPLWSRAGAIMPSDAHGAQGEAGALVYALGTIGYDFGTEAQQNSVAQAIGGREILGDAGKFLAYLAEQPQEATSAIWTLNQDGTAIYAIQPAGPFAAMGYERLREFMGDQLKEGVERVSVPGYLAGSVQLQSGQMVPVVVPELRGMYSWRSANLVRSVLGAAPKSAEEKRAYEQRERGIQNFLERVYYELRNMGLAPQERAVNYAATNAFQVGQVFEAAVREELALAGIEVERSPIARPGSDCWDVKLTFFAPRNRLERANQVYRIAVDVSAVVPVAVGSIRSWATY